MTTEIKSNLEELGIATSYQDACIGMHKDVSPEVLTFFEKKLYNQSQLRWQSALEPIYLKTADNIIIDVVSKTDDISIKKLNFENLGIIESNKNYNKYQIKILDNLPIGYHDVTIEVEGKTYTTTLGIAPNKCYNNPKTSDKKVWGFSTQLYALRSKQNWGVGDFSDLKTIIQIAAKNGADLIGINPINILNHNYPEDASPYTAISRHYINPIYIDVTKTKGYKEEYIKDANIEELRSINIINYTPVYELKIKVLEKIYANFIKKPSIEYEKFCKQKGASLDNLATFIALSQKYSCNWKTWPKEYQTPNTKEIEAYKIDNAHKINFFKFLQYEADKQFQESTLEAKKLSIGLYRDLPVGVGQCSAEVWCNQEVFIKDAGAGAPPDMFNPKGQAWGLAAFNPYILKQQKYLPMIEMLKENMKYAGALRLDHVMWLMRLFVIPNSLEEGTYVFYNFEDMLNILAIESHLNKCTIVGESIGNIPEGFCEVLESKDIAPISVLWAEKYDCGWGDFKNPQDYPSKAFVSISTHDMPPLKKWWFAKDILLQRKVGLILNDQDMQNAFHKREEDRLKLLKVLDNNGLWPQDNKRFADYLYGEDYPEGIEEAVHNLVLQSSSKGALLCLEDILQADKQQNLPGTDKDKYPNWRRKLSINLEDLEKNEMFVRNMALTKNRSSKEQ